MVPACHLLEQRRTNPARQGRPVTHVDQPTDCSLLQILEMSRHAATAAATPLFNRLNLVKQNTRKLSGKEVIGDLQRVESDLSTNLIWPLINCVTLNIIQLL